MHISKGWLCFFTDKVSYKASVNGGHLQVWSRGNERQELNFDGFAKDGWLDHHRVPTDKNWYDAKHRAVMVAVDALQKALAELD